MKLIFLISFFALLASCKGQQAVPLVNNADNNSLLWQVSGNGLKSPSYLYGTFHLMCSEDIHLSTQLTEAMQRSKALYFELDMDDPATIIGGMFIMNMKNGQTLKGLYNEEEYKKIERFITDSLGLPMMLMQRMKPALLEALLYPKLLKCKKTSGVEEAIMEVAKTQKKEIKGLETVQEQGAVFDSIPYDVQAKGLYNAIDSFATYGGYFDKMLQVYKRQQLDSLEKDMATDETLKAYNYLLLDKRNINWVKKLKSIMPEQATFVAVGAGHLIGDKGLIKLLRKEGFILTPLKNN